MITDEQARAAAERWGRSISYEAADTLAKWVRQELSRRPPPDDGPITAEWCEQHGADRISAPRGEMWKVGKLAVFWANDIVVIKGTERLPITTRSQLLALLAALRGEPLSPAGQLRGPLNNI